MILRQEGSDQDHLSTKFQGDTTIMTIYSDQESSGAELAEMILSGKEDSLDSTTFKGLQGLISEIFH